MTPTEEEFFRKAKAISESESPLPEDVRPKIYAPRRSFFTVIISGTGWVFKQFADAFVAILTALAQAFESPRCGICSNLLKRTSYTWTDGSGNSVRVCPHCNTRMEREKSRAAWKR